jgi:hypothetical protein
MKTIETDVTVTEDGKLIIETHLKGISPGKYKAVMVIDNTANQDSGIKLPLQLNAFEWVNWPSDSTFSREELYNDERC